jgi:hypothetical protein
MLHSNITEPRHKIRKAQHDQPVIVASADRRQDNEQLRERSRRYDLVNCVGQADREQRPPILRNASSDSHHQQNAIKSRQPGVP